MLFGIGLWHFQMLASMDNNWIIGIFLFCCIGVVGLCGCLCYGDILIRERESDLLGRCHLQVSQFYTKKKEIKRHSIHTIGNTEHLSQWLQDKELLRTSYWINGDRLIKADSSFENNKSIQLHTKWSHFEYIKLRSSLKILNLHTYTSISILFDILYLISLGYMIQH